MIIDGDNSDITFQQQNYDFEIKGALIELLRVLASGKVNKNLIYGDSELAIVFFNAIYKSNIDLIYLIDKYFGNLPAVFTYAIVNKIFKSSEVYDDKKQRKIKNLVKEIYKPFNDKQISSKISTMLKEEDINADVEVIYQSIKNLHLACPNDLGDWYFSGNYPTNGGNKVVNQAYINYFEGSNKRAY